MNADSNVTRATAVDNAATGSNTSIGERENDVDETIGTVANAAPPMAMIVAKL